MARNIQKLIKIHNVSNELGVEGAAKALGMKASTIERRLRDYKTASTSNKEVGKPVLVLPDLHAPYNHPQALEFLQWVHTERGCRERVASVGDMWDFHSMSFHKNEPDALSPEEELRQIRAFSEELAEVFPQGDIVYGNHCAIPKRKMVDSGLAPSMLRKPNDLYNMPDGWKFHDLYFILEPDSWDVLIEHGIGSGGKYGCANTSLYKRCSYVQGHTHSNAAVIYNTNHDSTIFGMNVGCLVDSGSLAQAYGRYFPRKGNLGCGVVYNGSHAEFIPIQSWPGFRG